MRRLLALALLLLGGGARAQEAFVAPVSGVRSSDAILVTRDGREITVRLHGIEWAKTNLLLQTRTRDYLRRRLGTGRVKVVVRGTPSRELVYGDVYLVAAGGKTWEKPVNVELTKVGLARWSEQYAGGRNDIRDAEKTAKATKSGLWSDPTGANVALPAPREKIAAATPKPTPSPRPTASPTPRPSASPTARPTPTPALTATPRPTPTVAPTAAPKAVATASPSPTPTAKPTPTSAPTATPKPTPAPTPTPVPTPTPRPQLEANVPVALPKGKPEPLLAAVNALGWPLGVVLLGVAASLGLPVLRLRRAPRAAIADLHRGTVRLTGYVRPDGATLTTPTGGIPALIYRERAWRFLDGKWNPIRNEAEATPFVLDDGTGTFVVDTGASEFQSTAQNRFYNGIHVAQWPTPPYSGDERAQVHYLAPETQVTVIARCTADGKEGFTLSSPTVIQGDVRKTSELRWRVAVWAFLLAFGAFAAAICAFSAILVSGLPPK